MRIQLSIKFVNEAPDPDEVRVLVEQYLDRYYNASEVKIIGWIKEEK